MKRTTTFAAALILAGTLSAGPTFAFGQGGFGGAHMGGGFGGGHMGGGFGGHAAGAPGGHGGLAEGRSAGFGHGGHGRGFYRGGIWYPYDYGYGYDCSLDEADEGLCPGYDDGY